MLPWSSPGPRLASPVDPGTDDRRALPTCCGSLIPQGPGFSIHLDPQGIFPRVAYPGRWAGEWDQAGRVGHQPKGYVHDHEARGEIRLRDPRLCDAATRRAEEGMATAEWALVTLSVCAFVVPPSVSSGTVGSDCDRQDHHRGLREAALTDGPIAHRGRAIAPARPGRGERQRRPSPGSLGRRAVDGALVAGTRRPQGDAAARAVGNRHARGGADDVRVGLLPHREPRRRWRRGSTTSAARRSARGRPARGAGGRHPGRRQRARHSATARFTGRVRHGWRVGDGHGPGPGVPSSPTWASTSPKPGTSVGADQNGPTVAARGGESGAAVPGRCSR